jgi:hypothetical protein
MLGEECAQETANTTLSVAAGALAAQLSHVYSTAQVGEGLRELILQVFPAAKSCRCTMPWPIIELLGLQRASFRWFLPATTV